MTRSCRSCHLGACLIYFANIADQFTDRHWWRQTVQRSPLSKFTFSRGPCVTSRRTAVDVSFLFNAFKECAWKFYSTALNLKLDLYSVLIEWWKCLFQCFSGSIRCFLTVFKEGSGNSFLRLANTHHIYQTRCSLDIEVMIVKMKTLHVEFFYIFFGAKYFGDHEVSQANRQKKKIEKWHPHVPTPPNLHTHTRSRAHPTSLPHYIQHIINLV